MGSLHQVGLLFHIVGIFLLAGGIVGGLVNETMFWQYVRAGSPQAPALGPLLRRYPMVIQAGSLLMLLSGLLMLKSVNWAFWDQSWFRVKLTLYVLLVLAGALVARPMGVAIGQQMPAYPASAPALLAIQRRLRLFHLITLAMLLALLWVTMFRF